MIKYVMTFDDTSFNDAARRKGLTISVSEKAALQQLYRTWYEVVKYDEGLCYLDDTKYCSATWPRIQYSHENSWIKCTSASGTASSRTTMAKGN